MPGADLQDLSVMLVDDDEGMRQLVRRMLLRLKVPTIIEAEGGQQALERLGAEPDLVNLVICDWNMPEMSGMDLFGRVREINPKLPFLMLTGRADLSSILAAKKAGIPAYIVKPISQQELKTKITFVTGKAA